MDFITFSFQTAALSSAVLIILQYFEQYLPAIWARSLKFGRAAVGHETSEVFFFEVQKRWFTHFYISAFTFSSWTLYAYWNQTDFLQRVFGLLLNCRPCIPNETALLCGLMMWIQVSRRLYECLFISKFSESAKMNVFIYATGHWHYFGAIVSIFGGCDSCSSLSYFRAAICLPLFAFAWIKQLEAHTILGNLRQGTDQSYKIPFGGLFQYVSCPNYLCEVILYAVYAFLFGFQNSTMNWVLTWVVLNQVYSAILSHTWYHKKFGDKYPKDRKSLIPFVF